MRASVTRTQEQTDLARFWISTAAQNWNPAARGLAIARGLTLSQNARAFALLNLAGADAFIASWDAKFAYSQWRPVTAIRTADSDGNPDTLEDPSWTPLLVTPPFPDYTAGHTTYAGAAEAVLEHVFGKSLLRSTWKVTDADGGEVVTAQERSLPMAIARRVVDFVPYGEWLPIPYNFDLLMDGRVVGHMNRKFQLRDRYVLDLSDDHERKLDRRLGIALAVGLDTLQNR